jgi:hypothetical protein
MQIFFNGCSYTWGDELDNRLKERYSRIVSTHFNAREINIARNGVSNDRISRTTMEWFARGNTCDLAVIQWTVISRFESYNGSYIPVVVQDNTFKSFYADYYDDQIGVNSTFKNAYLLEQFFISKKIKYIFLWHDCYNRWTMRIERNNAGETWKEWDKHDIMLATPCVWRDLLVKNKFNFIRADPAEKDRCILNNETDYVSSKGHPNPQGHQKIAQRIIDSVVV